MVVFGGALTPWLSHVFSSHVTSKRLLFYVICKSKFIGPTRFNDTILNYLVENQKKDYTTLGLQSLLSS